MRESLFTLMRIQPALHKDVFSGAFRQKMSPVVVSYMVFKFMNKTREGGGEGGANWCPEIHTGKLYFSSFSSITGLELQRNQCE